MAREMIGAGKGRSELAKAVGRGNARAAERVAEAAKRSSSAELEAMLTGLFEADVAIKANNMEPEPAISAWLGTHLLGVELRR